MPEKLIVAAYIAVISMVAASLIYVVTWFVQYVAAIAHLFATFAGLIERGG